MFRVDAVASALLVAILSLPLLGQAPSPSMPGPAPSPRPYSRDFDVTAYGAVPNRPDLDSTPAFQRALDAAKAVGGGNVRVPYARYWFNGNLTVDHGITIVGNGYGPYDPIGWHPWVKTQGPTMLPRSQAGQAFITIVGANGGLRDLMIAYPDQVQPNQEPKPYPPTVLVYQPSKITRCYIPNAYKAIVIRVGRVYVDYSHIGSYITDIDIDNAWDVVRVSNCQISLFHNWGVPPPDWWVLDHGTGILARKADGLSITDTLIFGRETGIRFEENQAITEGVASGYASNVNLDTVRNGIIAKAVHPSVGFSFTNLLLGPIWDERVGYGIWLQRGSQYPPAIFVQGGSIRLKWAAYTRVDAGTLKEDLQRLAVPRAGFAAGIPRSVRGVVPGPPSAPPRVLP